jgi:hypothetical protein
MLSLLVSTALALASSPVDVWGADASAIGPCEVSTSQQTYQSTYAGKCEGGLLADVRLTQGNYAPSDLKRLVKTTFGSAKETILSVELPVRGGTAVAAKMFDAKGRKVLAGINGQGGLSQIVMCSANDMQWCVDVLPLIVLTKNGSVGPEPSAATSVDSTSTLPSTPPNQ